MITIEENSKKIEDLFMLPKHRADFLKKEVVSIFEDLTRKIMNSSGTVVIRGNILRQGLELTENTQEEGYICMVVGMSIVTMDNYLATHGFTKNNL